MGTHWWYWLTCGCFLFSCVQLFCIFLFFVLSFCGNVWFLNKKQRSWVAVFWNRMYPLGEQHVRINKVGLWGLKESPSLLNFINVIEHKNKNPKSHFKRSMSLLYGLQKCHTIVKVISKLFSTTELYNNNNINCIYCWVLFIVTVM